METNISEMYTIDIKAEISSRQFELLDCTLDDKYRHYVVDRLNALVFELENRNMRVGPQTK